MRTQRNRHDPTARCFEKLDNIRSCVYSATISFGAQGVAGSNPIAPRYSGDISKFAPERILVRLAPAGFVIEVAEIVVHEGDEPDVVAHLFHADVLPRQHLTQVYFSLSEQIRPQWCTVPFSRAADLEVGEALVERRRPGVELAGHAVERRYQCARSAPPVLRRCNPATSRNHQRAKTRLRQIGYHPTVGDETRDEPALTGCEHSVRIRRVPAKSIQYSLRG